MLATVAVTVATHDLAKGVLTGVLLSGIFFAQKVSQLLDVSSQIDDHGRMRRYRVTGQVFFASSDQLVHSFDYTETLEKVHIDLTDSHFWDITAISALDKVVFKFRRLGMQVEVAGLNEASATLVDKFGVHDKHDGHDVLVGH
jgi:sulfate permease, SulP family